MLISLEIDREMKRSKRYQLLTKIGSGTFSTVYKAFKLPDKEVFAVKVVDVSDFSPKDLKNILNEITILASIHHPNIISYEESFIIKETKKLW